MSIFEDVYEVYYEAGTHRDAVTGPCEADTLLEALHEIDVATGIDTDVTQGDVVVVVDRESAEEISDRLGDDVHVTLPDIHVPREHVDLVPSRIEQVLPGKTQLHTVRTSSRFGVALDPSCVTYDNTIINPAGVVGIDWVQDDE